MTPSQQIDQQIKEFPDWRGEFLKKLRELIHIAAPEITEEWKWGTSVFTHNGMVCAISAFKDHAKMNFFKGAALSDPHKLFNAGLDAKTMRSIDFFEGDKINESALKDLIKTAVVHNTSK